jgi:hypothetical protein
VALFAAVETVVSIDTSAAVTVCGINSKYKKRLLVLCKKSDSVSTPVMQVCIPLKSNRLRIVFLLIIAHVGD